MLNYEIFRPDVVRSIHSNQRDLLRSIALLYFKRFGGQVDLDVTYGWGGFYRGATELVPRFVFDLRPKRAKSAVADCRELPIKNNQMGVVMFDPPFLIKNGDNGYYPLAKYGVFQSIDEYFDFIDRSLAEIYRVLKVYGVLVVKIQDVVNGKHNVFSHAKIMLSAEKIGFRIEDIFILFNSRKLIDPGIKNQMHARKFHCYFIVLKKVPVVYQTCKNLHSS